MPIKSNITDRRPRREKFKQEITLISGGYANRSAFPAGKITVYPWDTSIDAWLTEAANSATGTDRDRVLYDLMGRVCNLNGCKLEDFVVGDVNTVLMVARSIQNKNVIQYLAKCPKCGAEATDTIEVPGELLPVGQKAPDYNGLDKVTLDDDKEVVETRPLRIRDELAIVGRTAEDKARINNTIAHILAGIVSINSTQPDRIDEALEWYLSLSPHDAAQLEKHMEDSTPHLSQEFPQKCDACHHVYPYRLALDQEFFRSGRVGTAGKSLAANV